MSFTVNSKPGLADGVETRNVAQISFDRQPVIATDQVDPHDPSKGVDPAKQCLTTIDRTPPQSAVTGLPATSLPQFTVAWSGNDGPGAGIARVRHLPVA